MERENPLSEKEGTQVSVENRNVRHTKSLLGPQLQGIPEVEDGVGAYRDKYFVSSMREARRIQPRIFQEVWKKEELVESELKELFSPLEYLAHALIGIGASRNGFDVKTIRDQLSIIMMPDNKNEGAERFRKDLKWLKSSKDTSDDFLYITRIVFQAISKLTSSWAEGDKSRKEFTKNFNTLIKKEEDNNYGSKSVYDMSVHKVERDVKDVVIYSKSNSDIPGIQEEQSTIFEKVYKAENLERNKSINSLPEIERLVYKLVLVGIGIRGFDAKTIRDQLLRIMMPEDKVAESFRRALKVILQSSNSDLSEVVDRGLTKVTSSWVEGDKEREKFERAVDALKHNDGSNKKRCSVS